MDTDFNNLLRIKYPIVFVKFGMYEHLLALQKEGLIHCKNIHYFTQVEDGRLRGDADETTSKFKNISDSILELSHYEGKVRKSYKFKVTNGILKEKYNHPIGNTFSLFAIDLKSKDVGEIFTPDIRNQSFGDSYLIILDIYQFIERFDLLHINHSRGFIKYVDLEKINGERYKSFFEKHLSYDFQQEFRFLIPNDRYEELNLYLGNLSDISILRKGNVDDLKLKIGLRSKLRGGSYYQR